MENKLLKLGVKALKDFGYPDANEKNILTDYVYSKIFKKILVNTKEDANAILKGSNVATACESLLNKIKEETNL